MLRAFATFSEVTEVSALPEDTLSEPRAILRMDVLQKVSEGVPWKATRSRILAALIDHRKQLMVGDASIQVDSEGVNEARNFSDELDVDGE